MVVRKLDGALPSNFEQAHEWGHHNRAFSFRRILKFILLGSLAATLSVILPAPWTILKEHVGAQVRFAGVQEAIEWKDDIWPIRPQTAWDISTDFPYPRKFEYDVQEGTWLRLDVHPKSGDIVFDMVGDVYCISGKDASVSGAVATARPVLLGVPHDSDPHFSPEGDRLVFRSDAGLGVENIWVMPWKTCEDMDLRPESTINEELQQAIVAKGYEEALLIKGVKESEERRTNRLIREGRIGAQRVTNETYRWVSDPRFHPSGSKIVATKWYTSGRSLGAGEGWEFDVPSVDDLLSKKQRTVVAGSGRRVVGRTLPPGWTLDDYGDQQIGPEQVLWQGTDTVIYSKNIRDPSAFDYSKDVHSGIYSIFSYNTTSKRTKTLASASPGGASRPELSGDGRTLAFVRRVRDKEALVLKDLVTGTIHHVWHGLTYDLSTISAPMGTYPSFSFSPADDAVIIWAAGRIYTIPLAVNGQGERVSGGSPAPIRFTAHIEKQLAATLRSEVDVVGMETKATQRAHALNDLRANYDGTKVVFQAAGVTYLQDVGKDGAIKVPVLHSSTPYYSPAFVYGAENLIIHAHWSDTNLTSFEIADVESGTAHEVTGLPLGRYVSPILCECGSRKRKIAFIKTGGSYLSGDIVATAGAGLYIGDITLPKGDRLGPILIENLSFIPSEIDTDDRINMHFLDNNAKLLVQQSRRAFVIDIEAGPNTSGDYTHTTVASGKMSTEISVAVRSGRLGLDIGHVSFVDFFHVYLAPGSVARTAEEVWSKPANATRGLVRLSLDGGHDVTWSRDGKRVFWFLGSHLHSLESAKLSGCSSEIQNDRDTFGIACVKKLLHHQEIVITHSTDIARLRHDAAVANHKHKEWLGVTDKGHHVVIMNATLLTMASGNPKRDVVEGGIVVMRDGVITSVGTLEHVNILEGNTVINAHGGFVVPGFIDVHAHWNGFADRYPAKSWEMETFLAYGVTTIHNPSADNVLGFVERSRLESGQTIGPRIFTVGDVIYGAGEAGIHQDIVNMDEAYSALRRIKAEGGPASISYKNYNLPSRASRQRLLLAARNLSMLCVPEGGMNYDWDLTYILDGMTTVEHAIPIPVLYDDVLNLFAYSGTGYTPTHIVNYGGAFGEQLVWATEDLPNDPKLRRFTRHDILQELSESTARPTHSYAVFNTSLSAAKMVEKGLLTHIGAHGEPPLGLNYHAEMWFARQGGLTNYQVLQAATASAATTLGMTSSLGRLVPGALADLLVYPEGVDLINGDITATRSPWLVARGGRFWEAETMEEYWPVKGRKQKMPQFNVD